MPRCLVYNPYFAVLGGGERYTIALGSVIAETHDVVYAAPFPPNPELVTRFGFSPLDILQVSEEDFPRLSMDFDLSVFVTLDPPPRSFARHSIVIVQFPLHTAAPDHHPTRYVVYSEFAREWLATRWNVDSTVLMPGVALGDDQRLPKEDLVLSIGRFVGRAENEWNSKRQDLLITAFSQLPAHLRESWRLVLAGGCAPSPEMDAFLDQLRAQASGLDITIEINVEESRLRELQARARLFWHATGFGRPNDAPERAEHFGMSTVEAMSHRVVPLVYADGGQLEIVEPTFGRLWRSVDELVEQSTALMEAPKADLDRLGDAARDASLRFGTARFEAEARTLLRDLGALHWSTTLPGRVRRRLNRYRRRVRCGRFIRRQAKRRTQDDRLRA